LWFVLEFETLTGEWPGLINEEFDRGQMNPELKQAIEAFLSRFIESGELGQQAERDEVEVLNRRLGGIIPTWYAELITTYPICGISFQWQAFPPEDEFYGRSSVMWSRPQDTLIESTELYPGIDLLSIGFFNVACDEDGTGDPYFISATDGDNPTLYQIYHEKLIDAETTVGNWDAAIAAASLSQFFDNAIIEKK
jgi:hypothetical protein